MHLNVDETAASVSRMETSWLWKVPTLLHRPHKRVLVYELAYLFGYLKWFDAEVAGVGFFFWRFSFRLERVLNLA